MIESVGIIIVGMVILIAVFAGVFVKRDYNQQLISVKGSEYRKAHGMYWVGQFCQDENIIKGKEWLRQRNGGLEPKSYNRNIKYTEHFEECECLISRKGL